MDKQIEEKGKSMAPEQRFEENCPLVGFIFQKHFKRYMGTQYQEDLMQEGYLALWRACLTFNESLGYRFSTYAGSSIRFGMSSFLRKENKVSNRTVSIYDVIAEDGEGEELYLIDALSTTKENTFTKEIVEMCIRKLSDPEQVIVRFLLGEHTQKETAVLCNISQSNVSRCLHKLRKLVAKEMEN